MCHILFFIAFQMFANHIFKILKLVNKALNPNKSTIYGFLSLLLHHEMAKIITEQVTQKGTCFKTFVENGSC